jgi:hypothetical protein
MLCRGLGASELHACATATLTAVCDCAARELPAPGPPTATGQEALAVANLAWAVATHGLFHKRLLLVSGAQGWRHSGHLGSQGRAGRTRGAQSGDVRADP